MRQTARGLVITKDQKICLMKRVKNGQTYYTVLGGGVEPGETVLDALKRELIEEAGIIIDLNDAEFIDSLMYGTQKDMFFTCREIGRTEITGAEYQKSTPENSYELVELTLNEFSAVNLLPSQLKPTLISAVERMTA